LDLQGIFDKNTQFEASKREQSKKARSLTLQREIASLNLKGFINPAFFGT
jgi:hypothetical protein